MSDFVFNLDTAVAETAGGSGASFGTMETGIYDVTITSATLGKTDKGNNKLDLSVVTSDGHETTIYQAFVLDEKWASGSDNFGYKDWQAFAVVMGMKSMTTFQKPLMKDDGTPVMKGGQPIVLNAVKELDGKKCKMAVIKVVDFYKNEVTYDNEVFATFTEDGLNANEKINNLESASLAKLDGRLSDKKTKRMKAYLASGGTESQAETTTAVEVEQTINTDELGLD